MRRFALLFAGLAAGCALSAVAATSASASSPNIYSAEFSDARPLASSVQRQTVRYDGPYTPGTIIISTSERRDSLP